MLKIQLFSDELGTLVVSPDAIGTAELDQAIKRSDDNDGIVYEYSLDLEFTQAARKFLRAAHDTTGGIQARVIANLFEYDPNVWRWINIGTGKIRFLNYDISAEKLKTSIEQTGFERKVINLIDVDVDIETTVSQGGVILPATPVLDLILHPKKIIKDFDSTPVNSNEFAQLDVFDFELQDDGGNELKDGLVYAQIDTGNSIFKELDTSFTLPFGFAEIPLSVSINDTGPGDLAGYVAALTANPNPRNEIYRAVEAGVLNVDIRLHLKPSFYARNDGGDVDICGEGALGNCEVWAWIEHRRIDDTVVSINQIGTPWDVDGCGGFDRIGNFEIKTYQQNNINVLVGDKFYVYLTYRVYGDYEEPNEGVAGHGFVWHELRIQAVHDDMFINFSQQTEVAESHTKAVMIFEAMKKTCQYYTDQEDCFHSDYFGRTDTVPAYPVDGPGSLVATTNGRCMRQLPNQTIFQSLMDQVSSLNGIHCLGVGIETINGKQKIRVEPKSHFFNKNDLILDLGVVSKLHKKESSKYYYSVVEAGFPKLDIQQLNGIDEFTTVRKYKLPLTEISSKLDLKSKYKASGFEIESQRRLIGSTKDSKLDDANFLINVIRDGEGFKTESAENYPVVNNLFDPDSAYNLDYAPGRTIRNWTPVLAASVIRLTNKVMKFTSGDGNYAMQSQRVGETAIIDEDGDIDMSTTEPLWYPEIYNFERPLTSDEMRIIRGKPYGYFKFREIDGGPVLEGYLLKISRASNKKLGIFDLLRVYRNT